MVSRLARSPTVSPPWAFKLSLAIQCQSMCSQGIEAKATLEWLVSGSEEGWSQCWRIPRSRGHPSIMAATGHLEPICCPGATVHHGADVPPRSRCLLWSHCLLWSRSATLEWTVPRPLHCWWLSWGQSVTTLLPSPSLGWSLWSHFPGHQQHFRLPKPCYPMAICR